MIPTTCTITVGHGNDEIITHCTMTKHGHTALSNVTSSLAELIFENRKVYYIFLKFANTDQCMTLNISMDCHLGYLNLKIYSPIKFCGGHIFQLYGKN